MTKYHWSDDLKNRNLFNHCSETRSSTLIRVPDLVGLPWEFSSWLADSLCLAVSPHGVCVCMLRVRKRGRERREGQNLLPTRPQSCQFRFMTSFNLTCLLKTLSPDTVTLRAQTPTCKFWGDTIQSTAKSIKKIKINHITRSYYIKGGWYNMRVMLW